MRLEVDAEMPFNTKQAIRSTLLHDFLKNPSTVKNLVIARLADQPLAAYMNIAFAVDACQNADILHMHECPRSSGDDRTNILRRRHELLNGDTGKRAVRAYGALLRLPITDLSLRIFDFTPEDLQRAQMLWECSMADTVRRLVLPFQRMPFLMFSLVEPGINATTQRARIDWAKKFDKCCLDDAFSTIMVDLFKAVGADTEGEKLLIELLENIRNNCKFSSLVVERQHLVKSIQVSKGRSPQG